MSFGAIFLLALPMVVEMMMESIFAVVDVFDALTTRRPYKAPVSFQETMRHLEAGRGLSFDPDVLDAFAAAAAAQQDRVRSLCRALADAGLRPQDVDGVMPFPNLGSAEEIAASDPQEEVRAAAALVVAGKLNKQIAAELSISIKTVQKHRQQAMNKLNIHEIAGLTRYAMAKGWVEGGARLPL